LAAGLAGVLLLAAATASAQTDAGGISENLSKLSIHGYLSQAYAFTNGNQFLGITEDGTADYRALALQFHYDISAQDDIIIQFDHERLGKSPVQALKDDIELDWAFYEHRFSTGTDVKVGRVQMPFGIYNEVRDVGTLLPFYRPNADFYGEVTFTTESVDGIVATQSIALPADWNLSIAGYFGDAELPIPSGADLFVSHVKNLFGGQVWLETPIEGIRVGAGANRMTAENLLEDVSEDRVDQWTASVEIALDFFQIRSEYRNAKYEGGYYRAWYAQAGVPVGHGVSILGEYSKVEFALSYPFVGQISGDLDEDKAAGVQWKIRWDLVLKAEYHWNEGYLVDGHTFDGFPTDPWKTEYGILSLSTSF